MSITLWRAISEQKLTEQARMTTTAARAKNKIRNGTNLLRKNLASRKTKKSYTQEHFGVYPNGPRAGLDRVQPARPITRSPATGGGKWSAKKMAAPILHGSRH